MGTTNDRVIETRKRRRRTQSGMVLSAELITATAMRLIEEHGAAALSARRLGLALGADPTALYRYFRNTDDLLLAVADMLIGQALDGFAPTGDWLAALRELADRMYRTNLAHPRVAVLAAARVTRRPNEARGIESILGILHSAGFPDDEAVRYYHAFVDLVLSYSALDAAAEALDATARDADRQSWQDTYALLDESEHPNIARTAGYLMAGMPASSFPTSIDLFLRALAAAAGR
ncbi:MAG TPA: TetR/AcrR family transcriptional regulator [Pseudonocardiaceae bacterium]|jgi:AcrR family transcriptional regulator|nr:TetR/AcrR family transcriptional regulator [Pseudonocardiaceae bacterium]